MCPWARHWNPGGSWWSSNIWVQISLDNFLFFPQVIKYWLSLMTTSIHASWLSGLLLLGPQNQHQPFNIQKIRLWICCFLCRQHIRLDYCNVLLTGLPPCAIWPLQTVQNGAACVVFDQPSRSHVTPSFRSLLWLPVAVRMKFKALALSESWIQPSWLVAATPHHTISKTSSYAVPKQWKNNKHRCTHSSPTPNNHTLVRS